MHRSPTEIVETVSAAQAAMVLLCERVSKSHDVFDMGDLSVIQTTVRKVEELLELAAEYEDILRRRLALTKGRLEWASP